jgi:hypothetical protein
MKRREFIALIGGGCLAGRGARSSQLQGGAADAFFLGFVAVLIASLLQSWNGR